MKRGIYVGGLCLLTGGAGITLFLTQRANRDLTAQVTRLAQVQISDVRSRFSLARGVPGTLKGQLQTGDLVVFNP